MMLPSTYRQPSMMMVHFLSPGEPTIHAQVYLDKTVKDTRAIAPDRTNLELSRLPGRVQRVSLTFDEPESIARVAFDIDISNLPVDLPEDDEPFARAVGEVTEPIIGEFRWVLIRDLSLFTITERYTIKQLESAPLENLWTNALVWLSMVDSILERFRKASDATNTSASDGNEAVES